MVGCAVFHVGGHPDNNGSQDFTHLLNKGMLWIGGKHDLKKEEVSSILNGAKYFIAYKSKKLYGDEYGWYDIYEKTGSVHQVDSIDKWKMISDDEPSAEDISYFENNGVDFLIHVKKVYNGKVEVSNLPNMRRIQKITNPTSITSLMELI